MSKITYENKVALNENPSIADINKVKDTDMNEIKEIVNGNDNQLVIDTTEPEDLDNLRIWVNPDEPLQNVGTEVVNSLEGNETNMAPSVNAIKWKKLAIIDGNINQQLPTNFEELLIAVKVSLSPTGVGTVITQNISKKLLEDFFEIFSSYHGRLGYYTNSTENSSFTFSITNNYIFNLYLAYINAEDKLANTKVFIYYK